MCGKAPDEQVPIRNDRDAGALMALAEGEVIA
jgi:hypothetical protein